MKTYAMAAALTAAISLIAGSTPSESANAPPMQTMPASSPEAQALMKNYFGNTRICREDGIFECHMWLNADGTYILFGSGQDEAKNGVRNGMHVYRGTWSIGGTKGKYSLCRKQEGEDRQGCLPEPERPDLTGPVLELGGTFLKYHDNGALKGQTEHYYLVKGHV